jgi:hypothetical protein
MTRLIIDDFESLFRIIVEFVLFQCKALNP